MKPNYPVYIVSKGRWDSRLTAKALDVLDVPFYIVVEQQEYRQYASVIPAERILVLDTAYQRDYNTLDDLGDSKSKGPGPARNFAWDHSIANNSRWHWVMDDNIGWFCRLYKNKKYILKSSAFLRAMEDFSDRYENVSMAGPNYKFFVPQRQTRPPFILNTRIYSCNLIRNDTPFRWRGRYNEDTILSLDMLSAGWCTVQFNAFLQNKMGTQTMDGGCNTDFYQREGTLAKSQILAQTYPEVARVVTKYGRPHHYVDFRPFRYNKPILRDGVVIPTEPDNYGMKLSDQ